MLWAVSLAPLAELQEYKRRLGYVGGVDADARAALATRRRVLVSWDVDHDAADSDAADLGARAVALPPGSQRTRGRAYRLADGGGGCRLLLLGHSSYPGASQRADDRAFI